MYSIIYQKDRDKSYINSSCCQWVISKKKFEQYTKVK